MLKIYICPSCHNFRMVSRKPDAICFHCGSPLEKCEIEYIDFMNMTESERNTYKENYCNRIKAYQEKVDNIQTDEAK